MVNIEFLISDTDFDKLADLKETRGEYSELTYNEFAKLLMIRQLRKQKHSIDN